VSRHGQQPVCLFAGRLRELLTNGSTHQPVYKPVYQRQVFSFQSSIISFLQTYWPAPLWRQSGGRAMQLLHRR
jgi:hypothetical protein